MIVGAMERTAVLGLLISVANAFVQPSFSCPSAAPNGIVYRSSCYDFDGVEKTWTDARSRCRDRGGRLAVIPNFDVQSWLSSTAAWKFPSRQGVWLGIHDRSVEGTFYWDNYGGQDILATYFNWNEGEPDDPIGTEDCAYMRREYQWRWVDVDCNLWPFRMYASICEFNALPSSVQQASARPPTASLSEITARLTTAANSAIAPAHQDQEAHFSQDSINRKLLSAMGAFVPILITGVVALVIWRRRRRMKLNAATAAVALTTSAPKDTAAQLHEVHCPPERQSPIKTEGDSPFERSLKQKRVDKPWVARGSSSGNIYVDIDAFVSHKQQL